MRGTATVGAVGVDNGGGGGDGAVDAEGAAPGGGGGPVGCGGRDPYKLWR